MKTDTSLKIVRIIEKQGRVRVHDLVRELSLSNVAVHKQLKVLVADGKLVKIGKPPLVYYAINKERSEIEIIDKYQRFINKYYLRVTPQGEMLRGVEGFVDWVKDIGKTKEIDRLARRYFEVRTKANKFIKNELIDFTKKIKQAVGARGIDKVYGVDFYSLPEFGKTRLGQLVFYAKQSQNKEIINKLAEETSQQIKRLIKKYKVEAVAYVPHSIPRKLQFLKEYRVGLKLNFPEIDLVKVYKGEVIVAQKSLAKLKDRIENARETIIIDERKQKTKKNYKTVLIIDDATGSGASMNEVAKKLKQKEMVEKVIGFSLIGSYKGFEVIREI
ncbi:MAG: hypothetical protein ABIJ43_02005 [Candidatus Beckwithbacteria bacterium]|nr:hypothetical protein [Patescibacteria group bacterium]